MGLIPFWGVCRCTYILRHASPLINKTTLDLVSRFTLDSATQFLFGKDVRSLSAGLPYLAYSRLSDSLTFVHHPSNVFADAFLAGQIQAALRSRLGPNWPLGEFWRDKVKPHREIVDRFVEPLMVDALSKKQQKEKEMGDVKAEDESVTSLMTLKVRDSL